MLKRGVIILAVVTMTMASVALAAAVFSDVPSNHWAASAISWNADAGIMTGPGEMPGMFDPAGLVNRAQLAQVNQRMYLKLQGEMATMKAELEAQIDADVTPPPVEPMAFGADLDGDSEVPPVVTAATGTFEAELDGDTLTYDVTVTGLSGDVTAAHIHLGDVGVAGGPVHTITWTDGADMSISGTWADLTAEQIETLEDEGYYVNVHTAAHPDGEIRGQVTMDM